MVDRQVARRASGKRRTTARSPTIRAGGTPWSAFLAMGECTGGTVAARTYMGRSVPVVATLEDIDSTKIATEAPGTCFVIFQIFSCFSCRGESSRDCVPDDDLRALNDVCVQ